MTAATRLGLGLALGALTGLAGCGGGGADAAAAGIPFFNPGPPPPELVRGAGLFGEYCTPCHGPFGTGQGLGPPLLDTLYLPRRVSDADIARAITAGSPQRHWDFGAMPIVHRADPGDIPAITAYLRWLQGRAGLLAPAAEQSRP